MRQTTASRALQRNIKLLQREVSPTSGHTPSVGANSSFTLRAVRSRIGPVPIRNELISLSLETSSSIPILFHQVDLPPQQFRWYGGASSRGRDRLLAMNWPNSVIAVWSLACRNERT